MTIAYKDGKDSPRKGDSVMGLLDGKPVRGTVLSVAENVAEGHKFVLQSRGRYEPNAKVRATLKNGGAPHFVQREVEASDFELVYRHEAASSSAAAPEPKRKAKK
jgi:hypothetical protein